MIRMLIVLLFSFVATVNIVLAEKAIVYSLHGFETVGSPIKVSNDWLLFSGNFSDGVFEVNYKNESVSINGCSDLQNLDVREITGVVYTDKQILLTRKRACWLLSRIKKASSITFVKKMKVFQREKKQILSLFNFPRSSQVQCTNQTCYTLDNNDETLFFTKVLDFDGGVYYTAETIIGTNGRSRAFYLLFLNEKEKRVIEFQ